MLKRKLVSFFPLIFPSFNIAPLGLWWSGADSDGVVEEPVQTSNNMENNQLMSVLYSCMHGLICWHGFSIESCDALVKFSALLILCGSYVRFGHWFVGAKGWFWVVWYRNTWIVGKIGCSQILFPGHGEYFLVPYLSMKSLYKRSAAVFADLFVVGYT